MVKCAVACLLLNVSAGIAVAHGTPAACAERLLPPPREAATGTRAVTARDLIELRDFGRVEGATDAFSISPDGKYAALTLRRADVAADKYCIGLVLVTLDGSAPPRLLDVGGDLILSAIDLFGIEGVVTGTVKQGNPAWSPDGRSLAYLRRDEGMTRAWVIGFDGSPARAVPGQAHDVLGIAWGADGSSLLVTTMPALEASNAEIDREAATGYFYDERFRLSADTRPHPRSPLSRRTVPFDPVTGRARDETAKGQVRGASPRPAGASLFSQSSAGSRAWVTLANTARPLGPTRLHVETGGLELPCGSALCDQPVSGLWWTRPDELIVMRAGSPSNGGRIAFFRWRAGREPAPVQLFETGDLLASCLPASGGLICARETATHPRTIVRLDLDTGETRTLFDPNPEIASVQLGSVERIRWADDDGVRSFGDLVLPPSHKPGDKHPLIVVQYLSRGFLRGGTGDEYPIQLLAAHGFAVLSFQKPEPMRAMLGASDENAAQRVNVTGWAERRRIFRSLDAGIDAAIKSGAVDPGRIGITGFSDGASTVQFALNHSDRFKAAAISSCCDEPGMMFVAGPSYAAAGASWGYPAPGEGNLDFWRPQSLALNASRIHVPLLMQVADSEVRGAAETFAALKAHGSPVEMYVFGDEHHVKSHPAHRLAIYSRGVAWFDFWLRAIAFPDTGRSAESKRWAGIRDR
ncbi:MAG: Atxe2 family lasso peptide isopeptidase [Pseudomonadota bacterium]